MGQHDWKNDAEGVELVKKLFADGHSAAIISDRLGSRNVSRNAVIGVLHRLGLKRHGTSRATRAANDRKPSRKPRRPVRSTPLQQLLASIDAAGKPAPPLGDPTGPLVALDDLEPYSCRWPIGDPKHGPFGFCGARKVTGLPYCQPHALRAFDTPAQRAARFRAQQERNAAANAARRRMVPHGAASFAPTEEPAL